MKIQFKHLVAAAVAMIVATVSYEPASAKTLTNQYHATSAVGSGADHSLWFSKGFGREVGKKFDFNPAGLMSFFDDGTATLTGRAISKRNSDAYFDVAFDYDDSFLKPPSFKSENGSVATGDTFFRDMEGGSLTGGGILAGLIVSVSRAPADGTYATQFGSGTATNPGANNKNSNFGMANWFFFTVDQATCQICNNKAIQNRIAKGPIKGDVNIDLAPVPVPAGGILIVSGLAALACLRRRQRKSS